MHYVRFILYLFIGIDLNLGDLVVLAILEELVLVPVELQTFPRENAFLVWVLFGGLLQSLNTLRSSNYDVVHEWLNSVMISGVFVLDFVVDQL